MGKRGRLRSDPKPAPGERALAKGRRTGRGERTPAKGRPAKGERAPAKGGPAKGERTPAKGGRAPAKGGRTPAQGGPVPARLQKLRFHTWLPLLMGLLPLAPVPDLHAVEVFSGEGALAGISQLRIRASVQSNTCKNGTTCVCVMSNRYPLCFVSCSSRKRLAGGNIRTARLSGRRFSVLCWNLQAAGLLAAMQERQC